MIENKTKNTYIFLVFDGKRSLDHALRAAEAVSPSSKQTANYNSPKRVSDSRVPAEFVINPVF
jgi:hypothetical protein